MIRLDCQQGTSEWAKARIGIPTASCFDKLITPRTMKPSASAKDYMHLKLAEWLLDAPLDDAISQWMERGYQLEEEAVNLYELQHDTDTEAVGFILRDDRAAGASPDRLVGADGLLEIKCPSAKVHVGYLLGSVADDYRCQVQGQLYIAEREWCDVVSYCPGLPLAEVRVQRDEEFIGRLEGALDVFLAELAGYKSAMTKLGYGPKMPIEQFMEKF